MPYYDLWTRIDIVFEVSFFVKQGDSFSLTGSRLKWLAGQSS